jgi:hypothetical protein
MITRRTYALALLSTLFLINGDWGNKDVSEEKGRWQRQPINVAGQLTTHNGDSYTVDNISLNRQIKQIKLFALPSAKLFSVSNDKPSIRIMSKEPAKYLDTTNIDLVEIKKLEVPFPDITWIYEEEPNKGRKIEFTQLDITLADGSKSSYLASSRMMLYCDRETHAAGPQEKDVPLSAIKELTIIGYTKREEPKPASMGQETATKPVQAADTCPSCPVCTAPVAPAA